jgi:CheY-like chemotaxis protein
MALLENQAAEKGLTLVQECSAALPLVHADLQRLRQVLTNLIGNALKFTQQGEVRVRCVAPAHETAEPDMVRVDVIDTGIGIDAETLPLVFNEFFQAQSELTRRYGGSGLGLSISRRLAQLMGGDVQARSEPGEGSTFSLLLRPAAVGSELRAHDVAEHGLRMAGHMAKSHEAASHVGVVVAAFASDGDALAELERRVRPNVRLVWTTDPAEVSALAVREGATLVVLEVGNADGAAWQAAHAMQDVPELAATAVLLLPSLPATVPDEPSGVLDLGWISLVPKPFTAAQLRQAVTTAARSGGARRGAARRDEAYEVLVVDDDEDSRRVAATVLSDVGVVVHEAADGEGALAEMRRRAPDVVVLDLMMPVLDGFGVLAAMRADAMLADIPAVVLTAKSLTDREREFLSRSAVRVLQKGAHRLADVAALVLRAAAHGRKLEE